MSVLPTADEKTFWAMLDMLKEPLAWSQRQPATPQVAWAVRQAFVTVLTFMEHWAVKDGVSPANIVRFDVEAREAAKELIKKIRWMDVPASQI